MPQHKRMKKAEYAKRRRQASQQFQKRSRQSECQQRKRFGYKGYKKSVYSKFSRM